MKKSVLKTLGLAATFAVAALILSACGAAAPAEPTTDPNVIFTQVAETVMVSMTQTSEAMPPTATPEPTATIAPTTPPVPTVDVSQQMEQQQQMIPTVAIGPTATTQLFGNAAKWNTQSPVDGKTFSADQDFVFHVCMGNVGSNDWTTEYYLNYVGGEDVCYKHKNYVGENIEPGEKWCFDFSCKAPSTAGKFTTYWFMKTNAGVKITNGEVYFTYKVQ